MSEENSEQTEVSDFMVFVWVTLAVAVLIGLYIGGTNIQERMAHKKEEQNYLNSEDYKLFAACEAGLKANLKSPSSYVFVKKIVATYENPPEIYIEYDADNSYGTSLRGNFWCKFKRNGSDHFELIEAKDDFKPLADLQLFKAKLAVIKSN
ncbi:MAG: hypothetical protein JKY45_03220 [Emcibacter sp.]|nr:hypothetical protein [Emcibacter sp.]